MTIEKESTPTTPKKTPLNLFDYTEEELKDINAYDILNLEVYATQEEVKKAYRKSSLKYHPDKTGRGNEDFVFLAVKHAHDTLHDPVKRQAYDSTVLPFDDAIPPPRAKLLADESLLYKDDDFYTTFGPVFERNLRFDARRRPDAAGMNGNSSSGNGRQQTNKHKKAHKLAHPPHIGDAHTPIEQVHAFYEYWIHFESWRDFSQQAASELQVEQELENADSRFEKRWIQKEIDKRAKQLKKQEMIRIQTLVERAMEADPRLRHERASQAAAKEQAKRDREMAAQRKVQEAEQAKLDLLKQEEEDKERRAVEKAAREQEKKLVRKERQLLRKAATTAFEGCSETAALRQQRPWEDSYDMSLDVDFLCINLCLQQLRDFNEQLLLLNPSASAAASEPSSTAEQLQSESLQVLQAIRQRCQAERQAEVDHEQNKQKEAVLEQQQRQQELQTAAAAADENNNGSNGNNSNNHKSSSTGPLPWSKDELSALAKAIKKYPPGGSSRWESISLMVNNLCKLPNPRSKEECIEKYNAIARNAEKTAAAAAAAANTTANEGAAKNGVNVSTTAAATTTTTAAASSPSANADGTTAAAGGGDDNESDEWTAEQDQQLQDGLAKYPASMDKNERWTAIAKCVTNKTKKQCVNRFKTIREALKNRK